MTSYRLGMFELQLKATYDADKYEKSYRLGMFELQPSLQYYRAHWHIVIAWACLSCNYTKKRFHEHCYDSYRLGMFELQHKG